MEQSAPRISTNLVHKHASTGEMATARSLLVDVSTVKLDPGPRDDEMFLQDVRMLLGEGSEACYKKLRARALHGYGTLATIN